MLDLDDLDLPAQVRSLTGAVVDPDVALVLDRAHLAAVVPPERLVLGALDTAAALADLLDLPLASAVVEARVVGDGEVSTGTASPARCRVVRGPGPATAVR